MDDIGTKPLADQGKLGPAMPVGEETAEADALKPVRERVQQEPADELLGLDRW